MQAKVFNSDVSVAMFAIELERSGLAVLDIPSTRAGNKIKTAVEKHLRAVGLRRIRHYYVAPACAFVYFDPERFSLEQACDDVASRYS